MSYCVLSCCEHRKQNFISDDVGNDILGLEVALTRIVGLKPYIEIQNTISDDVGHEILGLTMAMNIKVGLDLTSE